jgi:hypothetical protein
MFDCRRQRSARDDQGDCQDFRCPGPIKGVKATGTPGKSLPRRKPTYRRFYTADFSNLALSAVLAGRFQDAPCWLTEGSGFSFAAGWYPMSGPGAILSQMAGALFVGMLDLR